jgi:SAM-dependent methyltransferase
MALYDSRFYDGQQDESLRSARKVVPIVLGLVPATSVCDLGCGRGTWLKAFMENGVEDVLGIDGDYVDRTKLAVPADRFHAHDLSCPLEAPRRFDLAVSLEVAEHLPHSVAESFVGALVALAPVVLFSAATPLQGGVGHVNEQWQEYWASIFARHRYQWIDCIRPRIWTDSSVASWYRQNTLLYASAEAISGNPQLQRERDMSANCVLSMAHPEQVVFGFRRILSLLPGSLMKALKRRVVGDPTGRLSRERRNQR